MERWDSIGITENGTRAAKALGEALVDSAHPMTARVYSWGQRRCAETAQVIADSMSERDVETEGPERLELKGPISNLAAYKEFIATDRTQEMLDSWQRGEDINGSLVPVAEYAPEVLRRILGLSGGLRNGLALVVTHDLYILPIISHAFRRPVEPPDYLDGIVIGQDTDQVNLRYGELSRVAQAAELLS
jgi:broad specificity phosphatase PhoE